MMKNNLVNIIIWLILIGSIIGGYFYLEQIKKKSIIDKQNFVAERDSIKEIENGLYSRLVFFANIKDSLSKEIIDRNETIISDAKIIVKLKKIISKGVGKVDTIFKRVPGDCLGMKLFFVDTTNIFRHYKLEVEVNNPPQHLLKETFNPFSLHAYLTRNKAGFFNGYVKVQKGFDKFIKIKDMKFTLEKDEYRPKKRSVFDFILLTQYNFRRKFILGGGLLKINHISGGYLGNFYDEHSVIIGYSF